MQQLPHQQQGTLQQLKNMMSWVAFLCRAFAAPVEVFLHEPHTFGARYFGINVLAATGILFVWPAFWPGRDPGPVFTFLRLFLVVCILARMASAARRLRAGPQEHSYYTGRPWLMRLVRRQPEVDLKGAAEPVLVWVAALTAYGANEALGTYLSLAGVALLISVRLGVAYEKTRALDIHDALADQRRIAEQWRRMRQDQPEPIRKGETTW
jgi:hypothetical protein